VTSKEGSMPRKLLRVALVAAIVPALAPEISSAQTVQTGSTVRTAAAPAQSSKTGVSGWLQRMRGEKPAPTAIKTVKFEGENPFEESATKADTPFDLEGNDDVRLLKSKQPVRRRPSAAAQEFEPVVQSKQSAAAQPVRSPAATVNAKSRAVATPVQDVATAVEEDAFAAEPATQSREDNPFPDDPPTKQRGHRTATSASETAQPAAAAQQRGRRTAAPVVDLDLFDAAPQQRGRTTAAPVEQELADPPQSRGRRTAAPDMEQELPDPPTRERGRRTASPMVEQELPDPPVRTAQSTGEQEFATPVDGEAPEAFPIENAAPPKDVNAGYHAAQGTTPRYRRTNLIAPNSDGVQVPAAPQAAEAQAEPAEVQANQPVPVQPMYNGMNGGSAVINGPRSALPVYGQPVGPVPVYGGPAGYARLDAALYPSPRQDIPGYGGSTMITNQAFDPHEMLYAHRYRGIYGPFYHKTYRSWVMTPLGICKSEKRVLVGTEVRVNYRSSISPFALFFPPISR
jgi:hypothetical protein